MRAVGPARRHSSPRGRDLHDHRQNAGPGGTWWENSYPGARADVGSHFYCYSFEPADHWTEYFSQHAELRDYFVGVMHKYGIDEHCRFETESRLRPSTRQRVPGRSCSSGRWHVDELRPVPSSLRSVHSTVRNFDIPGIDDFDGPSFHSIRGTTRSMSPARSSRSSAPAPPASRSPRRSPIRSSS